MRNLQAKLSLPVPNNRKHTTQPTYPQPKKKEEEEKETTHPHPQPSQPSTSSSPFDSLPHSSAQRKTPTPPSPVSLFSTPRTPKIPSSDYFASSLAHHPLAALASIPHDADTAPKILLFLGLGGGMQVLAVRYKYQQSGADLVSRDGARHM